MEKWDGPRTGIQGAINSFAADSVISISVLYQASPIDEFPSFFSSLMASLPRGTKLISNVVPPLSFKDTHIKFSSSSHTTSRWFGKSSLDDHVVKFIDRIKPLEPFINELRLFKSSDEINTLREGGKISGRAFAKVH
jgi:Xaa-Pro aminopeptidase